MIELTKEQKVQIVDNRRMIIARNVFELEVDIIVMTTQGRTDEVAILNQRIEDLRLTDLNLEEFLLGLSSN